jgi:hypothetical protein
MRMTFSGRMGLLRLVRLLLAEADGFLQLVLQAAEEGGFLFRLGMTAGAHVDSSGGGIRGTSLSATMPGNAMAESLLGGMDALMRA